MSDVAINLADIETIRMLDNAGDPSPPASGFLIYWKSGSFYMIDSGGIVTLVGGGSYAPTTATYIVQTPDGTLSAEQALSLLSTGLLKNTTGTGVLSIATPETDYVTPSGAGTLANKTLTSPTIADFTNAQHDHLDADDGGTLDAAAIASGTVAEARLPGTSACGVYNNANISAANGALTTLTFNTERFDTDSFHSTSVNTSRLTAPADGYYVISANVAFASNTTGQRALYLQINGTIVATNLVVAATGGNSTDMNILKSVYMTAGQYAEAVVYQNSGGALNVLYATSYSPEFQIVRIKS